MIKVELFLKGLALAFFLLVHYEFLWEEIGVVFLGVGKELELVHFHFGLNVYWEAGW